MAEKAEVADLMPVVLELNARIRKNPRDAKAGLRLAQIQRYLKQPAEAERFLRRVLDFDPGYLPAIVELAELYRATGHEEAALARYREAIALAPEDASLHYRLGFYLYTLRRPAEAEAAYLQALQIDPQLVPAYNNLAAACLARGDLPAALAHYRKALEIEPGHVEIRFNLAQVALKMGDPVSAASAFQEVLAREPGHLEANLALASLLLEYRGDMETALRCAEAAVAADAEHARANFLASVAHGRLGHQVPAAQFAVRAFLLLDRKDRSAADNLVEALGGLGHIPAVVAVLADVADAQPEHDGALLALAYAKLALCDWIGLPDVFERLAALPETAIRGTGHPFHALHVPGLAPDRQRMFAQRYAERQIGRLGLGGATPGPAGIGPAARDKLRIGYLFSTPSAHALVGRLAGVFERHDRSRFEIHAFSFALDDGSVLFERARQAVDVFQDLRFLSAQQGRAMIEQSAIDVLFDLDGLSGDRRYALGGLRLAPVMVNGSFTGSMGLPAMADYILGDRRLTPPDRADDFSECAASMPHACPPLDPAPDAAPRPMRADEGLPDDAIVFCAFFTETARLVPAMFDVWCRMLVAVPGSVLWMLSPEDDAVKNSLLREFTQRGLPRERLVLAQGVSAERHLARLPLADLALDTFPVSSGEALADALRAGVPVVTCAGTTLASRVGTSLLDAAGLDTCVATDLDRYQAQALALANDTAQRIALRSRLETARGDAPLFDAATYARDLERLCEAIRLQPAGSGKAPVAV